MRIITGESKGRKIKVPKGIRPTQDRVRESIFNILGDRIVNKTILDLFAGSGSFGLEAISRGARKATFVEINSKVVKVLRENINTLGCKGRIKIIQADAIKTIKNPEADVDHPDVIFADPPYNKGFMDKIVGIIDANNSFSLLILEHSKYEQVDIGRILRFGDTEVNVIEFKS